MFAVINLNSQLVYAPDFIYIIVLIEYDNNSSQIPRAKCLVCGKAKRIFMNIKRCLFFHAPCVYWPSRGVFGRLPQFSIKSLGYHMKMTYTLLIPRMPSYTHGYLKIFCASMTKNLNKYTMNFFSEQTR